VVGYLGFPFYKVKWVESKNREKLRRVSIIKYLVNRIIADA